MIADLRNRFTDFYENFRVRVYTKNLVDMRVGVKYFTHQNQNCFVTKNNSKTTFIILFNSNFIKKYYFSYGFHTVSNVAININPEICEFIVNVTKFTNPITVKANKYLPI